MADQFHGKVTKRIEFPERQLPVGFLMPFHQLGKAIELVCARQFAALAVRKREDVTVEAGFEVPQHLYKRRPIPQDFKKPRCARQILSKKVRQQNAPFLQIGYEE